MDDLAGLDWTVSSQQPNRPPPMNNAANYYPTLKPTPPLSGRSTPIVSSLPKPPSTPASVSTPQNDSFANLLPTSQPIQPSKNLSLKEQQALLEEQKRHKALEHARQWDSLGTGSTSTSASVSRTASPAPFSVQALNGQLNGQKLPARSITPLQQGWNKSPPARKQSEEISDILAAFDSSAPVDSSTNFPVPSRPESRNVPSNTAKTNPATRTEIFGDDDDPFGLGTLSKAQQIAQIVQPLDDNDDDVLGLLGKPVSDLPPPAKSVSATRKATHHPVDVAIAELVDMGFDAEKARDALATTESGRDVQAAVGHLLNQAHSASRNKKHSSPDGLRENRRRKVEGISEEVAWARQQSSSSRRRDEDANTISTKEPAKLAAEIGNNLFKTANSLWKAGQKKVNKAISEYNTEGDSSQPKWMRGVAVDPESPSGDSSAQHRPGTKSLESRHAPPQDATLTDEAALLEIDSGRPQPTRLKKSNVTASRSTDQDIDQFQDTLRIHKVAARSVASAPPRVAGSAFSASSARTRVTREMNEESSVYISPARRKKPTAKPVESNPEPDLLFGDISGASTRNSIQATQALPSRAASTSKPNPIPLVMPNSAASKPKPVSRIVPPVEASILQSSTSNRNKGTAAFKLGNYADAHVLYTSALRDIPKDHPLNIILLTNRALTSLKTGDPKQCIIDADQAIEIIGPTKGMNESITIGGDEGTKDMAPYWGKAMMRRAEAMEQLERWAEAAKVWKECVEAGIGGGQSIQGRARCEKASGTGQKSQPALRKPATIPKRPTTKPVVRSGFDDLSGRPSTSSIASSEAVTRLRAANDAAAKLDDERFALTDAVADRVEKWKKGKEQNLRALLQSLDTVLWADSGWKKVGMSELLNPNKVKINYMKGIAKVHPDKLPPSATTEQIMISGSVFSTLNEAWDGFKKENGL